MSSYGVLALDCKGNISDTICWIESATSAQFEGQVAPFCYPDNHFGPDVLFLMWNDDYSEFRTCLSQAKFRKELNQMAALRTLVPEWLYHENRDNDDMRDRSSKLPDELWSKWKVAETKLITNGRPCLRLMVQYPAESTASANPGSVPRDVASPRQGKGKKRKHDDCLATVSGRNGGDLFGVDTLAVLDFLKTNA